jgi:hypothetical protein
MADTRDAYSAPPNKRKHLPVWKRLLLILVVIGVVGVGAWYALTEILVPHYVEKEYAAQIELLKQCATAGDPVDHQWKDRARAALSSRSEILEAWVTRPRGGHGLMWDTLFCYVSPRGLPPTTCWTIGSSLDKVSVAKAFFKDGGTCRVLCYRRQILNGAGQIVEYRLVLKLRG